MVALPFLLFNGGKVKLFVVLVLSLLLVGFISEAREEKPIKTWGQAEHMNYFHEQVSGNSRANK
jgi:hypothetical protein